jgi:hypothetical protein
MTAKELIDDLLDYPADQEILIVDEGLREWVVLSVYDSDMSMKKDKICIDIQPLDELEDI